MLSAGSDPTKIFQDFAKTSRMGTKVRMLSLGQGQDKLAEAMIQEGTERGTWVYLQNCHLYTSWMPRLEEICAKLDPETVHKDFRLWLTSKPTPHFPSTLLQDGVKFTMEPPKGLRQNLRSAYFKHTNASLSRTSKPHAYRKLLFALTFFHALVQERRKFGPLGFNIPYEFNESDLEISQRQLELFLDTYVEVPFKVLNFLTSAINYGGRVTDYIDMRTVDILLRQLMTGEVLSDSYEFSTSGTYKSVAIDEENPRRGYMEYIEGLPLNADPEVFGLHANANIVCAQTETYDMFDSVLRMETGASAAADGFESVVDKLAAAMIAQLPPLFDLEQVSMKYPLKYEESMNTVLVQECARFNGLLSVMHKSLPELRKALSGLVVMSSELEAMSKALFVQRVPALWQAKAYPSLKPLNSWLQELLDRVAFIRSWIEDGQPFEFWISGFFFPQAFLTGTLQNYARKHQLPIDTLSFAYDMKGVDFAAEAAPADGVYIRGLYLEGARWDGSLGSLVESRPKQLYTELPTIHLLPEAHRKPPTSGVYRCPVYKVLSRRGTLSTTGHSTNFILWVEIPSNRDDVVNCEGLADQGVWIKAGVAAFCSLRF